MCLESTEKLCHDADRGAKSENIHMGYVETQG